LEVEGLVVGPLAANCYVVSAGGDAVVIDPGAEANRVLKAVGGREVAAILVTHGHSDHVGAVDELVAETGAPFMAPRRDLASLEGYVGVRPARLLNDGDRLEFGDISLTVIATPGHTLGSSCFYAPGVLFSGDTLFAEGVGRTDLPGGSAEALFNSIRERIFSLAGDTIIYPGHGERTTVAREKSSNPFFASGWV
jgi:glyoxylase-like metal-dependent hydrolase (beta-lactamase superfamily II)